MGKKLGWGGAAFTAAYLIAIGWLVSCRWTAFVALELNELGDFLAGAFGPLAILWLVLGFFQQGIELRQNSEALLLQAAELKNSVEQQAELVKVAREQLATDAQKIQEEKDRLAEAARRDREAAQPRFVFSYAGSITNYGDTVHDIRVSNNARGLCTELQITLVGLNQGPFAFDKLLFGPPEKFEIKLPKGEEALFQAVCTFHDGNGEPGRQEFALHITSSGLVAKSIAAIDTIKKSAKAGS